MANEEHVRRLVTSTAAEWNAWRAENPYERIDVSGAPVSFRRIENGLTIAPGRADFRRFNLRGINLTETLFDVSDLTHTDMSNTTYSHASLTVANLRGANLDGSVLRNCDFASSDLTSSNLTSTKFHGCDLRGVILSDAIMHNADFAGSDLTGAIFTNCDLRYTKLVGANLSCSSLQFTNVMWDIYSPDFIQELIDRGFAESIEEVLEIEREASAKISLGVPLSPIERVLETFVPPINSHEDMDLGCIRSVQDMFDLIGQKIGAHDDRHEARRPKVYYRGHGCGKWSLESSLDRNRSRMFEPELLRELTMIEPDEFRDGMSILDRLVLARHHSLPARLLDVTRNPLVALYFACQELDPCRNQEGHESCNRDGRIHMLVTPTEIVKPHDSDAVSIVAAMSQLRTVEQDVVLTKCPDRKSNSEIQNHRPNVDHSRPSYDSVMRRLVHFVARDKPYFKNAIDPRDFFRVFVVEPRRAFTRVRAQSGAFLLSGHHKEFEAEKIAANGPGIPIYDHYTIDIPRSAKAKLIEQLDYVQINDVTMLPGLEPVARHLASKYEGPDPNEPWFPDEPD